MEKPRPGVKKAATLAKSSAKLPTLGRNRVLWIYPLLDHLVSLGGQQLPFLDEDEDNGESAIKLHRTNTATFNIIHYYMLSKHTTLALA